MITKCGMRFKVDSFGRGPCGAFKGPAKGQCLNCMDEREYDLRVPANRRDLIHVLETVEPKAETLT